jgi:glc operon protein GlcG
LHLVRNFFWSKAVPLVTANATEAGAVPLTLLIYNPLRLYAAKRGLGFRQGQSSGMPMRIVHTLDYSEAKKIIDLIVEKALQMQKAAVIAVADSHGELIAFARMDGAPISSIRIAANKAWTAARERKPTKDIGEKVRHPEKGHDIAYYGDPRFVGWGGGIPVWKDGEVAGAVAVSGLSSSEDIILASLGVDLVSGRQT